MQNLSFPGKTRIRSAPSGYAIIASNFCCRYFDHLANYLGEFIVARTLGTGLKVVSKGNFVSAFNNEKNYSINEIIKLLTNKHSLKFHGSIKGQV